MGRENAKRAYRNSRRRIRLYLIITAVINIFWLLVSGTLRVNLSGLRNISVWFPLFLWLLQQLTMIWFLYKAVSPSFDEYNNLLDSQDITNAQVLGLYSYAQDFLWLCWVIQAGSLYSSRFYIIYGFMAIYVVYRVLTLLGTFIWAWLGTGSHETSESTSNASRNAPRSSRTIAQRRAEAGRRRF